MSLAAHEASHNYSDDRKAKRKTEKLDGVIYFMAPSAIVSHGRTKRRMLRIFENYLQGKSCEVFDDDTDVFLTDNDTVVPDMSIVCDKSIVKQNGIHGAPDLIVEILSPSTADRDRGYKKDLYERCGVKEYWIVDIKNKTIDVFWLTEAKYVLNKVYFLPDEDWLNDDRNDERDKIVYEFRTSLFDDLIIDIREVFEGIDDFS